MRLGAIIALATNVSGPGLGLFILRLAIAGNAYHTPGANGRCSRALDHGHELNHFIDVFGFFGLSGIVVNDSIILVMFYRHIRDKGMSIYDALEEAACQRLRAVLLTSLTTIAGLTPLLFETSRQAQFLIPMAVSIAFGLAFATLLILLVIPAMLSIYEDVHAALQGEPQTPAGNDMTQFSRLQQEQLQARWQNRSGKTSSWQHANATMQSFRAGFSNELLAKLSEEHFRQSCKDFPGFDHHRSRV